MVTRYNNPALHEEPRNQRAQILLTAQNESLYDWLERTGRFKSYESDKLHDDEMSEELEDIIETAIYNLQKEQEEAEEFDL
ncbi:DUF3134 family protein [Pelatocladus sp. BLCC-F211]|uniref:DUF3134 family protein n=1 Tax=Pelatocladus sp. BLCC-F211 TaxID=3342752 RepID=UPI0035BA5E77